MEPTTVSCTCGNTLGTILLTGNALAVQLRCTCGRRYSITNGIVAEVDAHLRGLTNDAVEAIESSDDPLTVKMAKLESLAKEASSMSAKFSRLAKRQEYAFGNVAHLARTTSKRLFEAANASVAKAGRYQRKAETEFDRNLIENIVNIATVRVMIQPDFTVLGKPFDKSKLENDAIYRAAAATALGIK